jgi:hypothetical protein
MAKYKNMKIQFFTRSIILISIFFFSITIQASDFLKVKKEDKVAGYFSYYYAEEEGEIYLLVEDLNKDFLYVEALASGVGSNDIGLDRGQLGDQRILHFEKAGPKLFLVENNLKYRSSSDNEAENRSIQEAFAQSVLAAFPIVEEKDGHYLINITSFLLQDTHGVSKVLSATEQGTYSLDLDRSAIYGPMTKNFPKNTEFEVTLTFSGNAKGSEIINVAANANAITVRQHHSFVELPDDGFEMREFDPRSGFFEMSYFDYSVAMDQEIQKRFIVRHRLAKKDPTAAVSEAVEPIIYYLDPGTPEPVRSALLDGAGWWNQAFEAAGYKDAFQIKILPDSADPLDIRYNMIQWVHRSTRGWSYGSAVVDPRTGEIIKGHVSLGSLRIRQDYLIACGLLNPYEDGEISEEAQQMALARLRQLSAHEVGHTLGLAHNYSASMDDNSSVMDYPHPNIQIVDGKLDLSHAYDQKIGEWDKMAILYGYQDFPASVNEKEGLQKIIETAYTEKGLSFISDQDARPQGSAHPRAHLWDNGDNAAEQLNQIMAVRAIALDQFSENAIKPGQSMSMMEEALAPIYFLHRYQVEAAAKVVGGYNYTYALRGDGQEITSFVDPMLQQEALQALLLTLQPSALALNEKLIELIPPKPIAYSRTRESMPSNTAMLFDPVAIASSASEMTLALLLNPERANRLADFHYRNKEQPGLAKVLDQLIDYSLSQQANSGLEQEISHVVIENTSYQLMLLANNKASNVEVVAITTHALNKLKEKLIALDNKNIQEDHAFLHYTIEMINRYQEDPQSVVVPPALKAPDGSPIGCSMND